MADIMSSDDKEMSLDEQLERCQLKCDKLETEEPRLSVKEERKTMKTEALNKVEEVLKQLESQQKVADQDREALEVNVFLLYVSGLPPPYRRYTSQI
ncbi:hypothetical protein PAMA_017723 [Pampus argenteus]